MTLDLQDVLLRLGAAALSGAIIGLNRGLNNKPIGMRTLGLVALGSASVGVAAIQFQGSPRAPMQQAASSKESSKAS